MPRKNQPAYRIDFDIPIKFGSVSTNATDDFAPGVNPTIGAPENLALTTGIAYSSAAPTAYINATWDKPQDATPSFYVIQISTDNTFATVTIQQQAPLNSAHIESLLPGTLYYVRVQAFAGGISGAWSATASITTATDTAPAGVPTSPAATWVGYGDLLITWVNPTSANFKDVKIVIRASSGGTIYRTWYSSAQHWLYTFAMNSSDTAGAPDSSLYVEMQSRTFSNVLSSTVNTGLVTKAAPATPTGVTQTWSGDTANNGTASADWTITWTPASDASYMRLQIDGVQHYIAGSAGNYHYSLALNTNEHSGTPDPVLSYSLFANDSFQQASTAVSGTATNQNPSTPTATLTAGFSILIATVTTAPVADFAAFEYVWKRDGTIVRTLESAAREQQYELSGASDDGYHSWTVVVRQKDAFGQFSLATTPTAVAFEALTLAGLRGQAKYTDSNGATEAVLAVLKDGVTTSGGVVYAA
jgi:hypothetical protein